MDVTTAATIAMKVDKHQFRLQQVMLGVMLLMHKGIRTYLFSSVFMQQEQLQFWQ